jgi:cytoskeletal protein RodZ
MSVFCVKPIAPAERLGSRLKDAREAAGLTLDQVSTITHVPVHYLEFIDQGLFSKLPKASVFRRAYIKEYAVAVGLSADLCVDQLTREAGLSETVLPPRRSLSFAPFATLSMAARAAVLASVVLLFTGYLAFQIRGVVEPPRLELFAPLEGEVTNGLQTTIAGQTEPEVSLTVNGQKLMVNDQGSFATKIDLAPGVNTIVISAIKKHGKMSTLTRHIVVKNSPDGQQVSLGTGTTN